MCIGAVSAVADAISAAIQLGPAAAEAIIDGIKQQAGQTPNGMVSAAAVPSMRGIPPSPQQHQQRRGCSAHAWHAC